MILFDRMIPYRFRRRDGTPFRTGCCQPQLGPNDLAAVISTAPLVEPQNFTNDRARLANVIQNLRIGTSLSAGSVKVTPAQAPPRTPLRTAARCSCDVCSLDAITQVANVLAGAGPRPVKVVFFIGANIESMAMEKPGFSCTPVGPRARSLSATCWRPPNAPGSSSTRWTRPAWSSGRMFAPERRADGRAVAGSQEINRNTTLLAMADLTGGRAVLNSNTPGDCVDDLFAETDSCTFVGFMPADWGADSRTRRVEVKVNRRDVEVRTRREYPAVLRNFRAEGATALRPSAEVPSSIAGLLPRRQPANRRHRALGAALPERRDVARHRGGRPRRRRGDLRARPLQSTARRPSA